MVVAVAATYLYVVRSGIFCQLFIHGALLESSIMKAETLNMGAQYSPPPSLYTSELNSFCLNKAGRNLSNVSLRHYRRHIYRPKL